MAPIARTSKIIYFKDLRIFVYLMENKLSYRLMWSGVLGLQLVEYSTMKILRKFHKLVGFLNDAIGIAFVTQASHLPTTYFRTTMTGVVRKITLPTAAGCKSTKIVVSAFFQKLVVYHDRARYTESCVVIYRYYSRKLHLSSIHRVKRHSSGEAHFCWLSWKDFILWYEGNLTMFVFKQANKDYKSYSYFQLKVLLRRQFQFTDLLYDLYIQSLLLVGKNQTMAQVGSRYFNCSRTIRTPKGQVSIEGYDFNSGILGGCMYGSCFIDPESHILQVRVGGRRSRSKRPAQITSYKPHYSTRCRL
jgi:hypothetical protein